MIFNKANLAYLSLLAVLFGSTVLLLSITVSDIVEQRNALRTDAERISEDYLRQPSLEEVTRNIEKREAEVGEVSKEFFSEVSDEFEFVKFLETLAGKDIKQKIKFDINKKVEEGNYFKVPLEITAEGNFSATLGYLEKLEKLNYFFEIDSIDIIDLEAADSGPSRIETAVRGAVYWL